ncbi:MAG: TIGR04086 family membrane protein [Firmicutes bacterium]|nr:TIGR04086 family membrane protein [Bacillota bacterium]
MRMANPGNSKTGPVLKVGVILQGLLLTIFLHLAAVVILAFLVSYCDWQAETKLLNLLAHVGVLAGAIMAGNRCERKAWLNGLLVGAAAFLILTWVAEKGMLFGTWLWWKRLFRMGPLAISGGILGGLKNT